MSTLRNDARFSVALYTSKETAFYLGVPRTTFHNWLAGYPAGGRRARPVLTRLPASSSRDPSIPFGGLAEGLALTAFRRAGVPLQRIRPALDALQRELGIDHALASKRLFTDGAEVLYDYADRTRQADVAQGVRELVVVRSGQRVFTEVVDRYLRLVEHAPDGWAARLRLPSYERAEVVIDPEVNFGQPYFAGAGVQVAAVLERWWAGEPLAELADDFGIPVEQIEDAARVAQRRVA